MTDPLPPVQPPRISTHRRHLPVYVLLGSLIALFFVPGWGGHGGRLAAYTHDLAHFPAFATIAAGLLSIWKRGRSAVRKGIFVVAVALLIALLIEWIQPLVGRSSTVSDWLLGAAGALAAVSMYLAFKWQSPRGRRGFLALAFVAFAACVFPLAVMTLDWFIAVRAFPIVDSFERPMELGRWKPEGCSLTSSRAHVTHGRYALKVVVDDPAPTYPSVFLADGPMDWSGYGRFAVDVFLDGGESRTLWIRADDAVNPPYDERAQMSVELKPGMNTIWVDLGVFSMTPGGRRLNLQNVQTIGIFLERPRPGDTIYLDRMVLSARSAL